RRGMVFVVMTSFTFDRLSPLTGASLDQPRPAPFCAHGRGRFSRGTSESVLDQVWTRLKKDRKTLMDQVDQVGPTYIYKLVYINFICRENKMPWTGGPVGPARSKVGRI